MLDERQGQAHKCSKGKEVREMIAEMVLNQPKKGLLLKAIELELDSESSGKVLGD